MLWCLKVVIFRATYVICTYFLKSASRLGFWFGVERGMVTINFLFIFLIPSLIPQIPGGEGMFSVPLPSIDNPDAEMGMHKPKYLLGLWNDMTSDVWRTYVLQIYGISFNHNYILYLATIYACSFIWLVKLNYCS